MKRFANTGITALVLITVFMFLSFYIIEDLPGQDRCPNSARDIAAELPVTYNDLFAGSGTCLTCHDLQVNNAGESVALVTDWRSSMMANSAKDPFWRAKVSHEGLVNPEHKEVLEDVCTTCHAPVGNKNAHHNGQNLYSISEMVGDPLALDGVQCTVCHQIEENSLGNYSGNFEIGDLKLIWGPYTAPFATPMINETGYTPVHSNHINSSALCATCHTLITHAVDNNGQPTGNDFFEQAVYQEWKNSLYPDQDISCAICHVPRIEDSVQITSRPPWIEPRSPYGMHHMQGANVFMGSILKANIALLGITADSTQLDSTINRNLRSLQMNTLDIELTEINRTEDSLFINIKLQNLCGHKFPTSYPSRRAFIELIVLNEDSQIVFHSGEMDENYQLINENPSYESHYNVINSEEQVQIYELVMGDINYEVTTVLERANFPLKDNRIPPKGFSDTHISYDTTEIVGNALFDPDFNREGTIQGDGNDILHFHVPLNGLTEEMKVIAKVHYQTVSSKWLEHMFGYSSDEIDLFKDLYENSDLEPVLVGSDSLLSQYTSTDIFNEDQINIFPNPANEYVSIQSRDNLRIHEILLFNNEGEQIARYQKSLNRLKLDLPDISGIYYIVVKSESSSMVKKIIKV